MAWPTPLWSLGGVGIYVEPAGDTGWVGDSGDATLHVLHAHETTVHDVGQESRRRTWRGFVVGQSDFDALVAMRGTNVAYITPMIGDLSGTCRVMDANGRSVGDVVTPTTAKFRMTIELLER